MEQIFAKTSPNLVLSNATTSERWPGSAMNLSTP
jgi:hypothetical protein